MNFLSHYYTGLPKNHPLFVTAAVIPDLTRGFSKTYNAVLKNADSHWAGSELHKQDSLEHIHSGILGHFEADKKFHNSDLFMQQVSSLIQSFLQEGLSRNRLRLSVIAHVAIEMMLDRQIILEKEGHCIDFYAALNNADVGMLETYFDHFSLNIEKRRFFANFSVFKERQYLFQLKNPENIVLGLNRLYSSVTRTEFTEEEKQKILIAMRNIDRSLRYSWQEILKG